MTDTENRFAFVHLLDIAYKVDKSYCYFLPPQLRSEVKKGSLVSVPFGFSNKQTLAVVIKISDISDYPDTKPVSSLQRLPFDIPEELIDLCVFIRERFFCSFGTAFRAVLPPGVYLTSKNEYACVENADVGSMKPVAGAVYAFLQKEGRATEAKLCSEFGDGTRRILDSMLKSGLITRESGVLSRVSEKNIQTLCLTLDDEEAKELASSDALTKKQAAVVEFLLQNPGADISEIKEQAGVTDGVIAALIKKGFAEKSKRRLEREFESEVVTEKADTRELTKEQSEAVQGLCALADNNQASAALLHGVTGSGKTRVIIQTALHTIKSGKQVIIMLPEIGLTAHAYSLYKAAFGEKLALIHSMLSVGERTDAFRRIVTGEVDVVLGTRSAVFAPFCNLGLIVMDEEQDSAYKSELSPKYNARDVARFRCAKHNALLLLASATPSVESFYKAQAGSYSLLTLSERIGGSLPPVTLADLRNEAVSLTEKLIGSQLKEAMAETLSQKRQIILFVNRRGYNSHISCRSCGTVLTCPNCSVSLTYHAYDGSGKKIKKLYCHYCGYTCDLPEQCSNCGGKHLGYFGFGTQKLGDELKELFPNAECVRMDSDTTMSKHSHERILEDFKSAKTDILYGTQMISKGLDFPNVGLVGMISADGLLYQNDFRAGERTFSLITQLVGRTGRAGQFGKAVIQTYNPDNEVLKLAASQRYEDFYNSEIKLRKAVLFPPFCSVAVFTFSSINEQDCTVSAYAFSEVFTKVAQSDFPEVKFSAYGPYPCGIYKIGKKFRRRIIVKYSDNSRSRAMLSAVLIAQTSRLRGDVKLELDYNPPII